MRATSGWTWTRARLFRIERDWTAGLRPAFRHVQNSILLACLSGKGGAKQGQVQMPTDRKIRWAANFFIWSAIVWLVAIVFLALNDWWRRHPTALYSTSSENFAAIVSFIFARFLYNSWIPFLVIVNGLALRRYRSRVAAGLFILLGVMGVGLGLFALWRIGFNLIAVEFVVFYGLYISVAVWTFVDLSRSPASPL